MKRQLMDPEGIQLYVESRSSALWPMIPEVPANIFFSERKPRLWKRQVNAPRTTRALKVSILLRLKFVNSTREELPEMRMLIACAVMDGQ